MRDQADFKMTTLEKLKNISQGVMSVKILLSRRNIFGAKKTTGNMLSIFKPNSVIIWFFCGEGA